MKLLNLARNYLTVFIAIFLQGYLYLATKASFLVEDMQDLMQDLVRLARK